MLYFLVRSNVNSGIDSDVSRCSSSSQPPFDVTICSIMLDFGWFLSFNNEVVDDDSISMTCVEFTTKKTFKEKACN